MQASRLSDRRPDELRPEDFFADIVGHLVGTLEDVIGYEDAAGFVAQVGSEMGERIAELYRDESGDLPRDPAKIAAILVDLKARIGGEFSIESVEPDRCMMTTNVFGRISSEASGRSKVRIEEAIATGHSGCRVVVSLKPEDTEDGHDFFA